MKGVIPGRGMEAPVAKAASWSRENEVNMYTFNSRVRYSETDEGGCPSVSGIINYMQDCSTFQPEDCGVGVGSIWKPAIKHGFVILADYDRPVSRTGGEAGGWNMALCVQGIYGYRVTMFRGTGGGGDGRGQG